MVNTIVTNLEGKAAEWAMDLHNKRPLELGNADALLAELRARFEDDTQVQRAESEM